jgi:hypothetical protein
MDQKCAFRLLADQGDYRVREGLTNALTFGLDRIICSPSPAVQNNCNRLSKISTSRSR